MDKIDRTGESTVNKKGQRCTITHYYNCKNITVMIVDDEKNRFVTLTHRRYHDFVRGLIQFDSARTGEVYRVIDDYPTQPKTYTDIAFSRADEQIQSADDEAKGRAIGCIIAFALLVAIAIFTTLIVRL